MLGGENGKKITKIKKDDLPLSGRIPLDGKRDLGKKHIGKEKRYIFNRRLMEKKREKVPGRVNCI